MRTAAWRQFNDRRRRVKQKLASNKCQRLACTTANPHTHFRFCNRALKSPREIMLDSLSSCWSMFQVEGAEKERAFWPNYVHTEGMDRVMRPREHRLRQHCLHDMNWINKWVAVHRWMINEVSRTKFFIWIIMTSWLRNTKYKCVWGLYNWYESESSVNPTDGEQVSESARVQNISEVKLKWQQKSIL